MILVQADISKAIYTTVLGDGDGKADASVRLGALSKPDIFVPNINAQKWNNEAWLNLNPRWFSVGKSAVQDFKSSTAEVTVGDVKIKSWPLSKDVLEYAVCFSSMPAFENIVLEVQHSGLEFYFQPHEVEEGCVRIPRVRGSIAVYHSKSNNQYKTGKFAHLYRWECIDTVGNKAWCGDLQFDGSNLFFQLPIDWLKKAVYPVVCMGAGDTIGYSACGASVEFTATRLIAAKCIVTAAAAGGTVTHIGFYPKRNSSSTAGTYYVGAYADNAGEPSNLIAAQVSQSLAASYDGAVSGPQETAYSGGTLGAENSAIWAAWFGSHYLNGYYYDTSGGSNKYDFETWPDPWVTAGDTNTANNYSLYVVYTAASGGTTISAEAGEFTITGADNSLLFNRILPLSPGEFNITGVNSTLLFNRALSLTPGEFNITGVNNSLLFNRLLSLSSGEFTITGVDNSLLFNKALSLTPGEFNITGIDSTLLKNYLIVLETGSFLISGEDSTLTYTPITEGENFFLNCEPGIYALTGYEAALLKHTIFNLDAGEFAITGEDVAFLFNRFLNAETGSFILTGVSAFLLSLREINLETGSYSITGQEASVLLNRLIAAESGSFTITGEACSFLFNRVLNGEFGAFTVTGVNTTLIPSGNSASSITLSFLSTGIDVSFSHEAIQITFTKK